MPQLAISIRVLFLTFTLASIARAQTPSVPIAGAEGPIRIWGHGHRGQDYILTLLKAWQSAFEANHPGIRFQNDLTGDASGLAGLYTNVADLAILDREASFIEVDAYQQGEGYDPFKIPVARGSVSTPHHAPALKVFVNPANPLASLTLTQLDGVFDADHRRGKKSYKTWGDLGVAGPLADKPIHIYTYEIQSAEIQFFERAALKGSQKFACCLTLFHKAPGVNTEKQIVTAVARDPNGLALVTMPAHHLKPIPLATEEGATPTLPTPESITAGTYPLARTVYLYIRQPKIPVPSTTASFLNFILSAEGQQIVAHTGGYLPLSPKTAAKATESLQ